MSSNYKKVGELKEPDRSAGVNNRVDGLVEQEYGLSRELIKSLPVGSIAEVSKKAQLLQDYLSVKKVQAEILLKHGHTASLLLSQLADLQVLQAERERDLTEQNKSLLDDETYMANHDRITKLLVELHKLGIDNKKLDLERQRLEMTKGGTAFVVAGETSEGAKQQE